MANRESAALVVLGTRSDPHVDRVTQRLEHQSDFQIFVVDYLAETRFSLEESSTGRIAFYVNNARLPERYMVWDRTKILPGSPLYPQGDEISIGYIAREWRAFYRLLCGLNQNNVVNPLNARVCMIKPYQQMIAASVGFAVPPTLVSNDRARIQEFQRANDGRLVLKSVSGGKVRSPEDGGESVPFNVMTMRISTDDIVHASDAEFLHCPHFFQREIDKRHELRVVVADKQILAFKIDSQKREISSLDWRNGIYPEDFSLIPIDETLTDKILTFMQRMGLFTGSLDLIVDPEEQVWFLECNQDGQWAWLDDIALGGVTSALVDAFSRRMTSMTQMSQHAVATPWPSA